MRALRMGVGLVVLVIVLAGCGGPSKATAMPDVTGKQLDVAKSDIKKAGFKDDVEVAGGGLFGVVDDSNWQVCAQSPAAGEAVTRAPRLSVDRSCGGDASAPSEQPTAESTRQVVPSAQPAPAEVKITDTTVDELLDRLNSAKMGGINVGDQFRVTGEMVRSDLWVTGASGDFSVLLNAKGGAHVLMVFVDKAAAAGWHDGTKVEMVLESVAVTVNGETTDGWLRARSVKVIS